MQDISLKYGGTQIKKVVVLGWLQRPRIIFFLFFLGQWCNGNVWGANRKAPTPQPQAIITSTLSHHHLTPNPKWQTTKQAVQSGVAATAREERRVTMEVVLGLFWSDFGSTKYMDKIQRRMYGSCLLYTSPSPRD